MYHHTTDQERYRRNKFEFCFLLVQIKHRRTPYGNNGYPDYFDDRHKRKMLRLAGIKSSDIFYDLGCGNASILILAVKEFDVKNAIRVEDDLYRNSIARKRVKQDLSYVESILYTDTSIILRKK